MIACLITLPVADTGYNLYTLVLSTLQGLGVNTGNMNPRMASITLQPAASNSGDLYIVPNAGAYSATAGVPAQYGWNFSNGGSYFDKAHGFNDLSLQELNVGVSVDGDQLAIIGIQV